VQSFTTCIPLLTAISAFGLRRRRWRSPQQLSTLFPYLLMPKEREFRKIYTSADNSAITNKIKTKQRDNLTKIIINISAVQ